MLGDISRYSILIVDDQPESIDILRHCLMDEDYLISATTSGEKAINLLSKINVDLILLDLTMPEMDGFETCLAIRYNENTRHIPIIFVTEKVQPEVLRHCFVVGAADLIAKPVHQEVVLARVKNQLMHIKQVQLEKKLQESNKLAELGSMVAEITHEVASPLGNLRLSIDYLVDKNKKVVHAFETQKLTKNDLEKYFSKVEKALQMSTANINLTTNIMQSFKKIAVDQCSNSLLRFNLLNYTKDIILTLRPKLKKHNHELILDIDPRIELNSYPGILSQVLINFVNNSLLHAFEKNVNGVIEISAQYDPTHIELIYKDNGIGMDRKSAENAFTKYYTTKAGEGGSGLGLAICRELVEEVLDGEITLQSSLGVGTCFSVKLDRDIAQKKPH